MNIVILGAGQAAAALAAKLRALGHAGPVTVIGDEPAPPYQRPPLSKAYLLGEMGLDRLTLRGTDWWAEQDIALRLGERAVAIDRARRVVATDRGEYPYDALALTLGAAPRRLPAAMGGALPGVHVVRNLADIAGLQPALVAGRRLVVIGGGYIGLEAAAVARKLGLDVTLVEAAPRILGRVAAPETAGMIRDLHRGHGVEIIEGVGIARIAGDAVVEGVELADGRLLPADLVICGIGVAPETALAEAAGLDIDNGIAVDARGRTSDPAIWAAGDCASFPAPGGRLRLESVGNAIDMAEAVAANMLGLGADYIPKPWFWSDQFDAKLQIAGLNLGYDRVVTRPGSVWYYRDGRLIAVDALNDARAYMIGKRLIEAGKSPDPETVAAATDLKALL
ncbi:3-phenylpropionate/trans-cinnamate dioxygenase ferredoxin reductase subunit [Paracoccus aminovorans]|uniref:3-phenylpropionate/trans-cinnamate dioxygenase ferredoxin reductase subunit n=1 Tax=Paracoccus aminovorans TaxID=34004 RepID=A0A1I3AYX3_9RHOB|nr:FAD-dependent oxidoreductase [Paracoccus aminovorans]CQR85214.1 FAD-dependent pyridine nucleotide-disulfide oxidoreductase [Paracoccus aminovorans]SFH55224.1 3-phenylpropionate/trans-cinnamate dioxygenase ferredoxin reductase subunit [Paracoccus aminovorans]